jgi:hypothetical protein
MVNDLNCGLFFNPHLAKILFLRLRECAVAFIAPIALDSLSPIFPKLFHFIQTIVTRHFEPCLSFAIGSQWRCPRLREQLRE